MDAIVYDLELVKRFKKGQPIEIVEIGACKVNMETLTITDQLQLYILSRNGYVPKSTRAFIHMDKEDMKNAISFRQAIKQFADWLGEDYYLCSWGKDDKINLLRQCLRQRVKTGWFKNYNDLQQLIGKPLCGGCKNQVGLKTALELAGIAPSGQAHRGIDDALNTAELLIRYAKTTPLKQNTMTAKELASVMNTQKPKPRTSEQHQRSAAKPQDSSGHADPHHQATRPERPIPNGQSDRPNPSPGRPNSAASSAQDESTTRQPAQTLK